MTVRRAFGELSAEGVLVAEQGPCVFAREPPVVQRPASGRFSRRHGDRRWEGCSPRGGQGEAHSLVGRQQIPDTPFLFGRQLLPHALSAQS